MEPTSWVAARHSAFQASETALTALVRAATGQRATGLVRIVDGYDSEVWRAQTLQGEYVVRIRRHGEVSYASEAWAIEQARRAGVPVAELLWVGEWDAGEGAFCEAMVQRAAAGRAVEELWDRWPTVARERALTEAGAALAALHTVSVGGYWHRRADGAWDFPTWEAVTASDRRDRAAEAAALCSVGFADDELESFLARHSRALDRLSETGPVLCHGDYLPGHWFADEAGHLTGVIDFGDFQGAPPLFDLAMLTIGAPHFDLTPFRAGYGNASCWEDEILRGIRIGLMLGYLAHYLREGNAPEIASLLPLLRAEAD